MRAQKLEAKKNRLEQNKQNEINLRRGTRVKDNGQPLQAQARVANTA